MSDAVNMIALAKMAVIVIGVFMVPVITRKFAADLGLPVGQMAMNRAGLATAALGATAAGLAVSTLATAKSHGTSRVLPLLGKPLRNFGETLSTPSTQHKDQDEFSPIFSSDNAMKRKAGTTLSTIGKYLEDSALRHKARKAGIQPPTLAQKAVQKVWADPKLNASIQEQERRYQGFLKTQPLRRGNSSSSRTVDPTPYPSKNPTPYSIAHSSPGVGSTILSESLKSHPTFSNIPSPEAPRKSSIAASPNVRSESYKVSAQGEVTSSGDQKWIRNEVQQVMHRWKERSRLERLFDDERKQK